MYSGSLRHIAQYLGQSQQQVQIQSQVSISIDFKVNLDTLQRNNKSFVRDVRFEKIVINTVDTHRNESITLGLIFYQRNCSVPNIFGVN